MKKIVLALTLCLSIGTALAQNIIEASTAVTVSPFVTATRLLQATSVAPLISTLATAMGQHRGVADKEQLKDELVGLNNDMVAGSVKSIEEVRQPALKELFSEIAADEAKMESINAIVKEGSELHKIATAVTAALLIE